jgi:hypothetical protein
MGLQAGEGLREDGLLSEVFGLGERVASPPTVYRVLCELAGLAERRARDWYVAAGRGLPGLDMFGRGRQGRRLRRVVPERPEGASEERAAALEGFTRQWAVRCAQAVRENAARLHGWWVTFGDATDLEVEGDCFDAAVMGREGKKVLRWQTVALGPIVVAQQLQEGNVDEGRAMPALLRQAAQAVRAVAGAKGRVLALLDAAYLERPVVEALSEELRWDFIIGANQLRALLQRLAEEQPAWVWQETGADARRGWRRTQVCAFVHRPRDWREPVTIVARRWIEEDEVEGVWHYAFVATRIEPADLPKGLREKHGYASAIWLLYGTKQGRENHYKTPLRDFGLHHPPSCRLGLNQAFYTLAVAASNVAMVMRYRVVRGEDRGMAFWRLRERYFRIAGYLVTSGRRLTVRLSGVCLDALRQTLWKDAFAAAGRL